ncbi:MAG: tetratricopeptide repeat protein [bacterium]
MKNLYDQKEVSRLIGISESQIRYWVRAGVVPPAETRDEFLSFDFQGLVAFRAIKTLRDQGASARKLKQLVQQLKASLPEVAQPLVQLRITLDGREIVIGRNSVRVTPEGQMLLDFDKPSEASRPALSATRPVEPVSKLGAMPLDDLFFQALELEERGEWGQARAKYEELLSMRPDHQDGLVNLGSLLYRRGEPEEAERLYRKALRLNPDHVEANYNLANLLGERGRLEDAVLFYAKALHEDADFADAHFNLAETLEKIGDKGLARLHWGKYLALVPEGDGAAFARSRIEGEP